MLKQTYFFEAIKKEKLTIYQYAIMHHLYIHPEDVTKLPDQTRQSLPEGTLDDHGMLTDKAKAVVKKMDSFFTSKKKIVSTAKVTPEFSANLQLYIDCFPDGKLPSGKYAKGDKRNIEQNMLWFFTEYDYTWDQILAATRNYVYEFSLNSPAYMYMATAMYFICKEKGKLLVSELANYCDRSEKGDVPQERKVFKTRVV